MASRKEEKERRRQERLAAERQQQEQARRRRMYSIGAGGVLAVAAVAAIVIAVAAGGGSGGGTESVSGSKLTVKAVDPPAQKTADLTAAANAANCSLSNPPIEGRTHTTKPVKYHTNPPSSGNHNPIPAEDGAYAKSPSIGHVVHSLEHGRIEIQYTSISRKRLGQLKGLFDQDPYHMLLLPNVTRMPYDVAAVAWGHIAGCKRITDATFDVIRDFTQRYRDKGPEFIP
jgi:hypothetical protein